MGVLPERLQCLIAIRLTKDDAMPFVNTLHPNRYHGFSAKAPFFEGWYYKLVSADEKHKAAIIPGVYLAEAPKENHSFVQVFISNDNQTGYHRYAYDAFQAARDAFDIRVGFDDFLILMPRALGTYLHISSPFHPFDGGGCFVTFVG